MLSKNDSSVDVSIIVPIFHGAKFLENILQMAKKNAETASDINIELVLVNDSPDDVPDFSIVKDAGIQTQVVINDNNLGIQRARLRGVENSHGQYLFFLDQDDIVADDIIIKLYKAADGGEASASDWRLELSGDDGIYSIETIADIKFYTLQSFYNGGNVIGPPGHCLIRRDCLPVCWTREIMKINGADDALLWMGMLAEGRKFSHCDGVLYVHKAHVDCFSNDALNLLSSEDEAFDIAAKRYGISRFWCRVHKQSIKYRRQIHIISKRGNSNGFIRHIYLLLYPEMLAVRMMNKVFKRYYIC